MTDMLDLWYYYRLSIGKSLLGLKSKLLTIWEFFRNIGIHPGLSKGDIRITRLINTFVFLIILAVLISFVYQIAKHSISSGEMKLHSFLMVITFSPYALIFFLNKARKYNLGRYHIIIYTLINNLLWTFTNVGQEANIYYANLILAIPIVIYFRNLKTQLLLIAVTFIFFSISYFVDINYSAYVINTYINPNFNIISFGIWLASCFLMMRFLLIEINSAEKAMHKQNSELEDFTRLASHDMKEPLRTIVSFSSLLKSKHGNDLPSEANKYLDYIENGANRLNNLLDDLSAYNRLNPPDYEELNLVDLNLILNELILDLDKVIKDSGTRITSDKLPSLKVIPEHMRQLFQNLITNGIKFQPKNSNHQPIIKLSYVQKDSGHEITCSDNGIGIPEENMHSVFEKFKRLHSRNEFDGTGLGLATCQKIIELYDGEISIRSTVAKGTSIIMLLPISTKKRN